MGILKDKVEKSIEKKREIREGQKKYADKCRYILGKINELKSKAFFEGGLKKYSEDDVYECAENVVARCEELHHIYLEEEPALVSIKGLKEQDEKIRVTGKKLKEDVELLLNGEIEKLLIDAINYVEKQK